MKLLVILCLAAAAAAAAPRDACLSLPPPLSRHASDPFPAQGKVIPAEPFTNELRGHVKKWVDRFPYLKTLVEQEAQKSSTIIKAVTNRGFLHYSQQVALQAIEAVDEVNYDAFVKYMVSVLEIPAGEVEQQVMINVFQPVRWADNSDWIEHTVTFSGGSGETKHVCILGHRNEARSTYDFIFADFKTSFQLAPDILIVTERKSGLWGLFGKSTTRIEKIPASLKTEDIRVLTEFFDMSAFARFAMMLDVPMPTATSFADPASVIAIVNAGLDVFQKITQVFKTTITNKILKEVMGEGFDFYVQRSTVQVLQGIRENNLASGYIPLVPRIFKLNQETGLDVQIQLCVGRWTDSNTYNKGDFLFNTDENQLGNVRFIDVLIQKQSDEFNPKYNIVVANVAQEFRLAPDVHIIETQKSFVGGIFETNKITYRRIPRALTEKDIEMLMAFFHITVFKRIAAQLKIDIKYPDPQVNLA